MKIELIERINSGAFADVWRARDALDREVAVKIVRPSMAAWSDALSHAKALARAKHENVGAVHYIERVTDPETQQEVDGVVMELLVGETLAVRLRQPRFSFADARLVGLGILAGLEHIHAQGLAHGDFHAENVMLVGSTPKIIDILYTVSLNSMSTANRETRIRSDLKSLHFMLSEILDNSEVEPQDATSFRNIPRDLLHLGTMRAEFERAIEAKKSSRTIETIAPGMAANVLQISQKSDTQFKLQGLHAVIDQSVVAAEAEHERQKWALRHPFVQLAATAFIRAVDSHEGCQSLLQDNKLRNLVGFSLPSNSTPSIGDVWRDEGRTDPNFPVGADRTGINWPYCMSMFGHGHYIRVVMDGMWAPDELLHVRFAVMWGRDQAITGPPDDRHETMVVGTSVSCGDDALMSEIKIRTQNLLDVWVEWVLECVRMIANATRN